MRVALAGKHPMLCVRSSTMSLLRLGTIDITPAVSATLATIHADPATYLARHQQGDWGDVDEVTQQDNDLALEYHQPICSMYRLSDGTDLLVITSGDRSSTRMSLATEDPVRKVSTQQGYAVWAATYDREKNALIAVEEPYADAIVATLPMTTALDVGTGTGRHALKLARRGIAVTAIDQSLEMLAVAQNTARTEGLPIDFRRASLDHDLPFAQGKFDFLVCALMLCHVADLMHAVQEFFRVLQPGGYLLITAFHPDAIERGWRTNPTIAGIQYLLPNIPHTQTGYIEALTGTGFHILKVIDAIVGEVPDGYLSEAFRSVNENKTLCLIVLAQRPA